MPKLNLRIKYNSPINRDQVFLFEGKDAGIKNKTVLLKDVLEKEINKNLKIDSKHITEFNRLQVPDKVKFIIEHFINNNGSLEYSHMVFKKTDGRDFNSFQRIDSNQKDFGPLALVFRLKDHKNDLFTKNTIIIETKLIKVRNEENSSNPFATFEVLSLQFTNLPERSHQITRGMIDLLKSDVLSFSINEEGKQDFRSLNFMYGLSKPIDVYNDDSSLNISTWKTILSRFNEYYESRRSQEMLIFSMDKKVKVSAGDEEAQNTFILFKDKTVDISEKLRYTLANSKDYNQKAHFKIVSNKNLDLFNLEIKIINNKILELMQKNEDLLSENDSLSSQILDAKLEIDKYNEIKTPIENEKISLNNEITQNNELHKKMAGIENSKIELLDKKISTIESEIESNKKEIKLRNIKIDNLKKNSKKSKKNSNKKSDSSLQDKKIIIGLENKVTELKKQNELSLNNIKSIDDDKRKIALKIKEINKKLEILNKPLEDNENELNNKINGLIASIKAVRDNINKTERIIWNNKDTMNSNSKEIASLHKYITIIRNLGEKYDAVEVRAYISIDDEKKGEESLTVSIKEWKPRYFVDKLANEKKWTWIVSDYDAGHARIIRRNWQSFINLSKGAYKSPYLAIDLNNPNLNLHLDNKASKQHLNDMQNKAFQMINNSYQASFLQGPPGTGKTQVISNTIAYKAQKGEISLISSSTNEAINNAFDRINRDEFDNPNIFFLRVSNSEKQRDKAKNYLEDAIPTNFINKIFNFINKNSESYPEVEEILEKYDKEKINKFIAPAYAEFFFKEDVVSNDPEHFAALLDIHRELDEEEKEYFWEDHQRKLFRKLKSFDKNNLSSDDYNLVKTIDKLMREHGDQMNYKYSNHEFLSQFVTDNTQDEFTELTKKLQSKVNGKGIEKSLSKNILEVVSQSNLVNIIGITTTSRLSLKLNGAEREIFIEYPVDFAVVDEVSKSITPEIIQISSLASQFLYAGDYRQLPPNMDFSIDLIKEFWKWDQNQIINGKRNNFFDKLKAREHINNPSALEAKLKFLFEHTLFKHQVQQLKGNYKFNSYVALNEQYRFTSDISELVNIVYDDDERLITHFEDEHFKQYSLDEFDNSTSHSRVVLDTSYLSRGFQNFAMKNNASVSFKPNDIAFDQQVSIFNGQRKTSMINEYNAFVDIDTILKLKNNNNVKPEDIGIITMTRSQAQIIKTMIRFHSELSKEERQWLNKIKIDTVDNFQGREKEIIIVDFVRALNHVSKENKRVIEERGRRNLDHYKKNERLNVAVSRAKAKLILVGAIEGHLAPMATSEVEKNGQTINIKIFQEFLDKTNENGKVVKVWEQ